jgi:hypothetical protein
MAKIQVPVTKLYLFAKTLYPDTRTIVWRNKRKKYIFGRILSFALWWIGGWNWTENKKYHIAQTRGKSMKFLKNKNKKSIT